MATSGLGIFRRIRAHTNSSKKSKWTHFSFFVVWENITEGEISELESLFRGIYEKDDRANSLNRQKGSKKIDMIRRKLEQWTED
jgi:hypothetical protein